MRTLFVILLSFAASTCWAAGLWYGGTSSDLSATVSSTSISYPVVMAAWVAANESPDDDCVISLSDNNAGGSLDALQLRVVGTSVQAIATAAGASSSSSASSMAATGSQFIIARFDSASSRQARIGTGGWSTAQTTTRNVGNFTKVAIGALHNGNVAASFDGPITSAAIWTGVDADNITLMADQLSRGVAPDDIWHVSAPYLYQPLRTGINESGKIGATLTATGIDFEQDILDDYANQLITLATRDTRLALARIEKASAYRSSPDWGDLSDSGRSSANHDCWSFRWPDDTSSPGPLPFRRIVKLGSDSKIVLAGSSDTKWIGATASGRPGAPALGDESVWWRQMVRLRDGGRPIYIDEVNSPSWTIGTSEAFLAADGKCDDTGTVAIGIVVESADGVATVVPY